MKLSLRNTTYLLLLSMTMIFITSCKTKSTIVKSDAIKKVEKKVYRDNNSVVVPTTLSNNSIEVPSVYSNMYKDIDGRFYLLDGDKKYYELPATSKLKLQDVIGQISGYKNGLKFDFNMPEFNGLLYYGFIPYGDSKHPYPVYFKKFGTVTKGKTKVNLSKMAGKYDMIDWETKGRGTLGYRLISQEGKIYYDGIISFTTEGQSFLVSNTIIEGPFVNKVNEDRVTISLTTNNPSKVVLEVNGQKYTSNNRVNHEILIDNLAPATQYKYSVKVANNVQSYDFTTAPKLGSRKPFVFSYASDSRNGKGGGERNVYGTNAYIMKKIMAVATQKDVKFMQFSGDLINGYLTHKDEMNLQYANWKRAIEPFAHYFPVYCSMGNHEALITKFDNNSNYGISVDRFPFETESAEAIFSNNFVHPTNGPLSEDGASYDPQKDKMDFPSYKENVYYYTYDNVAVVVMNSNYLYAPSTSKIPLSSGGMHAYIMDEQVKWVKKTVMDLESNPNIDHVFITEHTPFFPNGGHTKDDMWYSGNNKKRTYINGKPLQKGIIERRDELLDLFVNKSTKVIAILTGDEHNYARTEIGPDTKIYPEHYELPKLKLSRTIYQINNGAAGAPYYAQELVPWSNKATGFTTQNAIVFFNVNGKEIEVEVVNPDTLEPFDSYKLR